MFVDRQLLEILVCPVTKQLLFVLNQTRLDMLNQLISEGSLYTVSGNKIMQPMQQALITENGTTIYRVDDSVPIMLEDQSIAREQIPSW